MLLIDSCSGRYPGVRLFSLLVSVQCVVPVSLRVVSSPLHASDRWFTVFAVERHMVAINMPPLVKHVAQFQQEGVHRRDPEGGLILTCCAPRAGRGVSYESLDPAAASRRCLLPYVSLYISSY